jgi:hypothetical protein
VVLLQRCPELLTRNTMLLRLWGMTLVALALGAAGAVAHHADEKEIVGVVKEVKVKEKLFVLTLTDKSERTFKVSKETKFIGPRGSDREDGLQDDCMSKGYEVKVVPAADQNFAKEVKLPLRKKEDEKKKKG